MPVLFKGDSELATLSTTFQVDGEPADPTTVMLVVTDPNGEVTTYNSGQLTNPSTGVYSRDVACTIEGLWQYIWVGTGAAVKTQAGTWFVTASELRRLYVPLEELKLSLTSKTDALTGRDPLLLRALTAASRGIDAFCGQRFWRDGTASARSYLTRSRTVQDSGDELLLIDPVATATDLAVEVGTGTSWAPVDGGLFELSPDNALADQRAVTGLLRVAGRWSGSRRVRVTARWGWPTVPDEVVQATLLQATRLYRRKDSPEGVLGSADWGAVRLGRIDPDVKELTEHLRLPGIG
ncbi:hypothetical protein Val02_82060 [Virgisporangium aliadipatigenens]|uniref:Uncharacterized protein n=1 Tax=Virgisporangium aliadipatigenens TaxID=741659 RepID=A0A8J3YX15_9ACTN|nr:hypothetical protein [Virgisporangium aliadipatigenens]GIJ51320.1 hypothetical protein Val02_82060 [Virgisporangium aliadipatigenens]